MKKNILLKKEYHNNFNPNNFQINEDSDNILKKRYLLTESQYQKEKMNEEYSKLNFNSNAENIRRNEEKMNERFYNLSLKKLFKNASNSYIKILNELSLLFNRKNVTFNEVITIFVAKDRLVYIGLLFVILAICFSFITITN